MTVYKDKERGTWYFIVRVKQLDGSTKQVKRRGFETKKDAQIAEAEALTATPKADSITLELLAKEYLEWYSARRKESSTNKVESVIRVHLIPEFGKTKIEDIGTSKIMDYQTKLIKKYSANHVKKIHATFSALFNFAVKRNYTKENPARIVGSAEIEVEKKIDYWTLDEFKVFMKHVDNQMYYALFMTLYYSGMRRGELLALTWADVNFENSTISVNKSVLHKKVTTPKTKSSVRELLMPSQVMRLLSILKSGVEKAKPTYVVFGNFHDNISTTTLGRHFDKYVKASGVNKIRIHDFRHSHASYLINKGFLISIVAKRLGHSNPSTTLDIYSHLYPSTEADAIKAMEKDFEKAKILKMLP